VIEIGLLLNEMVVVNRVKIRPGEGTEWIPVFVDRQWPIFLVKNRVRNRFGG